MGDSKGLQSVSADTHASVAGKEQAKSVRIREEVNVGKSGGMQSVRTVDAHASVARAGKGRKACTSSILHEQCEFW
eukprot:1144540-Pelagomonas_calceolata.AAC.10